MEQMVQSPKSWKAAAAKKKRIYLNLLDRAPENPTLSANFLKKLNW
jgi:hypothetical protein